MRFLLARWYKKTFMSSRKDENDVRVRVYVVDDKTVSIS